jgi:DNA-binding IclR family transcriptional regulator
MNTASEATPDRQMVTALARGLALLGSFRAERPLLTNAELAKASGLPRSSVSRLTHTLVKLGYLEYETQSSAYRLGAKVLSLSYAMSGGMQLRNLVGPYMQLLAEEAKSHVALVTCEDFSMLILDVVSDDETQAQPMPVGAHMTLDTTAMGRAYLASCSVAERTRIVEHLLRERGRKRATLERTVERAREEYATRGYCTSVDDWRHGVTGVAVPLFLRNLGRRIVLTCGGVASQMSEEQIHAHVAPRLMATAKKIEAVSAKLRHF